MAEQPIRLLIVDDIQSTRDNLRKLLSFEDDIQVVGTAGDGKEGVEEAQRLHPDIVLTDVNMPVMDGITFITHAKKTSCKFVPILVLTTEADESKKTAGREAGAAGWLVKPFKDDQLVAVVRKFVR